MIHINNFIRSSRIYYIIFDLKYTLIVLLLINCYFLNLFLFVRVTFLLLLSILLLSILQSAKTMSECQRIGLINAMSKGIRNRGDTYIISWNETFRQSWLNAGPQTQTLAQPYAVIVAMTQA